jgi:hypothetical protein
MANSNKRPMAVFSIKKLKKIGDFILKVRTIVLDIVNNPAIFVTPNPTVAVINTNIANLETAETLAKTRVTGSASARDLKYDVLLKSVHGLLNYVQTLADNAVDEPTSVSIINASGFDLKNRAVKTKSDLTAKNGTVSGSVILIAKSADKRASYNWQQSRDGENFTDLPTTLQAKTTVTGLGVASIMYFRFRAITKTGTGSFSQRVSIVVQ